MYDRLMGEQVLVETMTATGKRGRYEVRIRRNERVQGEPHYIEIVVNGTVRNKSDNYPTLEAARTQAQAGLEMIRARG